MRKILFLLLSIFPIMGQAQNTFAPVGAEWWYGGDNYDYSFWPGSEENFKWVDHVQSLSDTMVAGVNCRKLTATRIRKNAITPDSAFIALTSTFYVYDNTDTVFICSESSDKFIPLYVFNVQESDTVCLSGLFHRGSDSTFCYVVDSIRTELFDTSHLRTFYTHALIDSGQNLSVNWGIAGDAPLWRNKGKYTERLGGTWPKIGGLWPTISMHAIDGGAFVGFPSGGLRCYNDANYAIKMSDLPCDSISQPYLSITDIKKPENNISVFPNPSSRHFTITMEKSFDSNTPIYLTDISGRNVYTYSLLTGQKKLEIESTSLQSGIYFLVFHTVKGKYYQKISIRP